MYCVKEWKEPAGGNIAALKTASIEVKTKVDYLPSVNELRLLQWGKEEENILYSVVLCQSDACEKEDAEADISTIQLFESRNRDDASQAFVRLVHFVSLLKFNCNACYSVQQLSDLITPEGPIASNDLIAHLVRLNIPEPLDHPDLQAILHSNGFQSHLLLAAEQGSERAVEYLLSGSEFTESTDGPFHSKICKPREISLPKNSKGEDALIVAAKHGKLPCALKFLLKDFSANSQVEGSGDTALHVAACAGYPLVVKALLLFGADSRIVNNEGKTAIDACSSSECSANVKECARIMKEVQMHCDDHPKTKMPPLLPKNDANSPPCLLCLDGGGIRGLVEVVILTELDAIMRELDPSMSHLVDCFDFIAGTSTGSFVAASLVYQRLPPASLKKIYYHFKDNVFSHEKRPIKSSVSDRAAKEAFGDINFLSTVKEPKIMITTTMSNISPPLQHLMCNYGEARDGQKAPHERKVWEACRASSAAPTYFESFERVFVDGGVVANNPTLDAMTEVLKLREDEKKPLNLGVVLSLGTGVCEATPNFAHIPHIHWWNPASIVQAVRGAIGLLNLLIQEDTASNGPVVKRAKMWCKSIGCPYFRLSPDINPAVKLADTNDEHLVEMMYQTLVYARQNRDSLKEIAYTVLSKKRQ